MTARSQGRRTITILAWIVLCTGCATGVRAGTPPPVRSAGAVHFEIAAGDAATRLNEFGNQAGLQVLYDFESVLGLNTHAVRGDLSPTDALERMIAGTGLIYQFANDHTVALTLPGAPPPGIPSDVEKKPPPAAPGPSSGRAETPGAASKTRYEVIVSARLPPLPKPVGASLITLERDDIEAMPFVTVPDVVHTLPQIFGGGPSEDTHTIGPEAQTNAARGSGVNLRALGAGSTLVLINGRRMAGSGTGGIFVDVASLPLAAVDRVDIIPESSSTLYGADAVGGVVNFVMRDSFAGQQTEAHFGASTRGSPQDAYLSQLVGFQTESGHGLAAIDYYSHENLPASKRSQVRSNLVAFGGGDFDLPFSNPGTLLIGPQTWAIPSGQDGTHLDPSSLVPGTQNKENRWAGADVLPAQQRASAYLSWENKVSDNVSFVADGLFTDRLVRGAAAAVSGNILVPDTNPFYVNPTGGTAPVIVSYNFVDDLGPTISDTRVDTSNLAASLEFAWPHEWHASGTVEYASEVLKSQLDNGLSLSALQTALADPNPETAFNPFGDGSHNKAATIDKLRARNSFDATSTIRGASAVARGPLMDLRSGEVTLALGADYRQQLFSSDTRAPSLPPAENHLDRLIRSAFAELRVPVFGEGRRLPLVDRFELSAAARYESYSDFGSTTSPRYGLVWAPIRGLTFRTTWAESLRPPGLDDLDESNNATFVTALPDSKAAAGQSLVLIWSGNNKDLRQETARSSTFGFDLDRLWIPGLSFAATFFRIDFTDRLTSPAFVGALLTDPAYADLVLRDPTAQQRADVCSRAPRSPLPGACLNAPISAIVDLRARNDASVMTRGFDAIAKYVRDTRFGRLTFGIDGTYIQHFEEAISAALPRTERVSTQNYPVNLRFRQTLGWHYGPFDVATYVNFTNSYRDTASTPERHVSSWTTLDMNIAYTLRPGINKTTIALGVENLADRDPPFLNNQVGVGYDQENADPTGRLVSLTFRQNW